MSSEINAFIWLTAYFIVIVSFIVEKFYVQWKICLNLKNINKHFEILFVCTICKYCHHSLHWKKWIFYKKIFWIFCMYVLVSLVSCFRVSRYLPWQHPDRVSPISVQGWQVSEIINNNILNNQIQVSCICYCFTYDWLWVVEARLRNLHLLLTMILVHILMCNWQKFKFRWILNK